MLFDEGVERFREADFALIADWGFNFARLPLSYWNWARPERWLEIDERGFERLDEGVALGRRYGIHVNLNLHRAPGYCVNRAELEPHLLFGQDSAGREQALAAFAHHWRTLAARYRGIPNAELSFDLLNEPPFSASEERYVEVVRRVVSAIREVDAERLIIIDGLDLGQTPVLGLEDLGVAQSTRGYLPKAVSHYQATWVPAAEFESFEPPTWPLLDAAGRTWDRAHLKRVLIEPWQALEARGVGVHVGEWGCHNRTPHAVALGWIRDLLSLWQEAGWGFALWNLRGSFGVLDSERQDVKYESHRGHALDRELLELLRAH
jgi:endoglucanase